MKQRVETNSVRTHTDPLEPSFAPWRYLLAVDEVNYDLEELVAFAERNPSTNVIDLASGANLISPPQRLMSFVVESAADPLFCHDYDGPNGHLVGRAAVAAGELARGEAGLRVGPENVIITAGASAALALAAQGLRHASRCARPAALVMVPTFPLVGACLAAAGFEIIEVASHSSSHWLPAPEELIAAATPATTVIYVNTYNNPSGEYYRGGELRRLVRWAKENGMTVLHDIVTSEVTGAEPLPHLLSIAAEEGGQDRVITVGSLSKTMALPGFRVGWLIGEAGLVRRLSRANELAAPSSPAVAVPALLLDRLATTAAPLGEVWNLVNRMLAPYLTVLPGLDRFIHSVATQLAAGGVAEQVQHWRAALHDLLETNAAVVRCQFADLVADLPPWHGDFNTFVRVPALTGRNYLATTHRLFREYGLQTLPAPVFGFDEAWWSRLGYYTRLSFALPTARWIEGLIRLRWAVRTVAQP